MDLHTIKTAAEYEEMILRLETLLEHPAAEGEGEIGEEIELLSLLVENYEENRFPIRSLPPVELLREVMTERGLAQKDLAPLFGNASRVSDFFNRKRGLSLPTLVALNREFKIPFELLIDKDAQRKPRGVTPKSKRRNRGTKRAAAARHARRATRR